MNFPKPKNTFKNIFFDNDLSPWNIIVILYNVVCILVTIFIIGWWFYQYSMENLAASIDIHSFLHHDQEDQPMFSVCTTDPKLDEKIVNLTNNRFNETTYLKYLRGEEYHEELRNIDYKTIGFNWSEYFSSDPNAWLLSKRGKSLGRVSKSKYWNYYTSYVGLQSHNRYLTHCIGVQPLRKEVSSIYLFLKMNIFKHGIRPSKSQEFRIFLHYPHQIIRSYSTRKSLWNPIGNESSYIMRFVIKDLQVLQRYPTRKNKCIRDWRNYDKILLKKVLERLNCQAPHQQFIGTNYSVCSNKGEMKETLIYPSNRLIRAFEPPCRSLETSHYQYSEETTEKLENDTFRISFHFHSQFKEIVQYPTINKGVSNIPTKSCN